MPADGGDLPCITSREENDFLLKLATQGGFPEWTCCWLNGTDEGHESDWRWATGETFVLQENLDATGGTSENYLNLRLASGQWEDYPAEGEAVGEQWFACEWK